MNKTWLTIVIIASATLLAIISYNFYISITGGNVTFDKSVADLEMSTDLGQKQLTYIKELNVNISIPNSELDNK
jgi:hypothetical protein